MATRSIGLLRGGPVPVHFVWFYCLEMDSVYKQELILICSVKDHSQEYSIWLHGRSRSFSQKYRSSKRIFHNLCSAGRRGIRKRKNARSRLSSLGLSSYATSFRRRNRNRWQRSLFPWASLMMRRLLVSSAPIPSQASEHWTQVRQPTLVCSAHIFCRSLIPSPEQKMAGGVSMMLQRNFRGGWFLIQLMPSRSPGTLIMKCPQWPAHISCWITTLPMPVSSG